MGRERNFRGLSWPRSGVLTRYRWQASNADESLLQLSRPDVEVPGGGSSVEEPHENAAFVRLHPFGETALSAKANAERPQNTCTLGAHQNRCVLPDPMLGVRFDIPHLAGPRLACLTRSMSPPLRSRYIETPVRWSFGPVRKGQREKYERDEKEWARGQVTARLASELRFAFGEG